MNCKRNEACENCNGHGRIWWVELVPAHDCPRCHGTGRGCEGGEPVRQQVMTSRGWERQVYPLVCPTCNLPLEASDAS